MSCNVFTLHTSCLKQADEDIYEKKHLHTNDIVIRNIIIRSEVNRVAVQ